MHFIILFSTFRGRRVCCCVWRHAGTTAAAAVALPTRGLPPEFRVVQYPVTMRLLITLREGRRDEIYPPQLFITYVACHCLSVLLHPKPLELGLHMASSLPAVDASPAACNTPHHLHYDILLQVWLTAGQHGYRPMGRGQVPGRCPQAFNQTLWLTQMQ